MLALWSLQIVASLAADEQAGHEVALLFSLAVSGMCVFLGFRGNALTARHYIACGYELTNPRAPEAQAAVESWGL
jgi:hypothetical protein